MMFSHTCSANMKNRGYILPMSQPLTKT